MDALVLRPVGFKDLCTAPPLRFGFVRKDKAAFAAFVETIRSWHFDRIVTTHGAILEEDAEATFRTLTQKFVA